MAGLDRKLGTLEPGKLGHVVAFTAPFNSEQAKARFVLIDGLKFEIKPAEPAQGSGAGSGRGGSRRGPGAKRTVADKPAWSSQPTSTRRETLAPPDPA